MTRPAGCTPDSLEVIRRPRTCACCGDTSSSMGGRWPSTPTKHLSSRRPSGRAGMSSECGKTLSIWRSVSRRRQQPRTGQCLLGTAVPAVVESHVDRTAEERLGCSPAPHARAGFGQHSQSRRTAPDQQWLHRAVLRPNVPDPAQPGADGNAWSEAARESTVGRNHCHASAAST
jgi:hypothetical protein